MISKDKLDQLNKMIICNDLKDMMRLTYEILENPAFVVDMGYNVLAYTDVHVFNERWNEIVVKAKLSANFVDGNVHVKAEHAKTMNSKVALLFKNTFMKENQIKKALISEGKKCGMLMVLPYHRDFEEIDLEYADIVGNLIANKLTSHKGLLSWQETGMNENMFFLSLLEGRVYSAEQIALHLSCFMGEVKKYWYICTGRGGKKLSSEGKHLDLNVFNELDDGTAFLYNTDLVIVLNTNTMIKNFDNTFMELSKLAKEKELRIGISNVFEDIGQIKEYYNQARTVLYISEKLNYGQTIYLYQNFGIYDMFERVPVHILRSYIHPDILILKQYDEKNGTELCGTLLCYLNCNRSQAKAASLLYIHRNTVNYRVNQCREIMKSELNKDTDLFLYTLSLMILEYIEN